MEQSNFFDLSGQHILLTGGSGLLGRPIAALLTELGATITNLDISGSSSLVRTVQCDLSDSYRLREAVADIVATWGPIDTLINNAASRGSAGRFFDAVEDYDPKTWSEVLSVNLDAVFWMSQIVGSGMAQRGSGCIINTASIYGSDLGVDQRIYPSGFPRMNAPASYAASKAGVIGLTRYLAAYWGSSNIRVNAVAPGGIENGQPVAFREAYSDRIPMGRMADASDIVGVYAFLASSASRYMTGQCLYVDGGLSCW